MEHWKYHHHLKTFFISRTSCTYNIISINPCPYNSETYLIILLDDNILQAEIITREWNVKLMSNIHNDPTPKLDLSNFWCVQSPANKVVYNSHITLIVLSFSWMKNFSLPHLESCNMVDLSLDQIPCLRGWTKIIKAKGRVINWIRKFLPFTNKRFQG